ERGTGSWRPTGSKGPPRRLPAHDRSNGCSERRGHLRVTLHAWMEAITGQVVGRVAQPTRRVDVVNLRVRFRGDCRLDVLTRVSPGVGRGRTGREGASE